jgi:hypothetical protein
LPDTIPLYKSLPTINTVERTSITIILKNMSQIRFIENMELYNRINVISNIVYSLTSPVRTSGITPSSVLQYT